MSQPMDERPVDTSEVPAGEDIDLADAEQRLDEDPEEQKNWTDPDRDDDT